MKVKYLGGHGTKAIRSGGQAYQVGSVLNLASKTVAFLRSRGYRFEVVDEDTQLPEPDSGGNDVEAPADTTTTDANEQPKTADDQASDDAAATANEFGEMRWKRPRQSKKTSDG